MLSWDITEEYAVRFRLPSQSNTEEHWQFRERVARSLEEMGERLLAHEVLYNRRLTGDSFAFGNLSSGYEDTFITRMAQRTEQAFQHEKQILKKQRRQRRICHILIFWRTFKMRTRRFL